MRHQISLALAMGFALFGASAASAQDVAGTAADVATDAQATAESAVTTANENLTTIPSAAANPNLNAQGQTGIQGRTGTQVQTGIQGGARAGINATNQPNAALNTQAQQHTQAQQRLNVGQQSAVPQAQTNLNTQSNLNTRLQPGQVQAGGQLSAQALDQRLGLQFDNAVRTGQGLAIGTIQPNSVFYSSGLRQGDVLMSIDNRPIANQAEFTNLITTYPQTRVPLIVMRNGQRQTIYFDRPADFVTYGQPVVSSQAILGVTFDSSKGGAAVIRSITPDSPAEQAGIMIGDVISGLNGQPILAAHEVVDMIAAMQPGQQVTIDLARGQQKLQTSAVLAARSAPVRHSVGYAPDTTIQPVPVPAGPVIRDDRVRTLPVRPGDPDGDGRLLDGDGRVPRRVLNDRR